MPIKKFNDETGSAVLEFLLLGLALNIGVLTFAVTVLHHHQAQLAAESMARHAARALATGSSEASVTDLLQSIAKDFAVDSSDIEAGYFCEPNDCDLPDGLLTYRVKVRTATVEAVMPLDAIQVPVD